MKHKKIHSSSNIDSVGYDEESKTLEILFKSGGHYSYEGVPVNTYKEMMGAKSIGSYVHQHIKRFKFKKVK